MLIGLVSLSASPAIATEISTSIDSSSPITIATLKPGDKAVITARLRSTDQQEDTQNEWLFIQVGGLSIPTIINTYGDLATFSVNASVLDPSADITAFVRGADGDESAEITVSTNEPQPSNKSPDTRAALENAAKAYRAAGLRYLTAAKACTGLSRMPFPKADCLFLRILAGYYIRIADAYDRIALDPIDTNYTVIVTPQPISLSQAQASTAQGFTDAEVAAWNGVFGNLNTAISLSDAITTSLNRASGAAAVGDTVWEGRQVQAAMQYALQ